MQGIGTKIAKGAAWMVAFKLAERSLGLVSTIILARLLVPADFGLVALSAALVAAFELMRAFGFDMALIQNQKAERRHYDTVWTFNVLFGAGIAASLVLLASPATRFFNEPRLANILYFLALGSLVQGWENVGIVAFRKEMEFNKEFRFLLAKKVFAFVAAVPAALLLRNYWALVIGMLTGRVAGVILSYQLHPYRPRLSLAARSELVRFSRWLLINNFLFFLRVRSADFVIGKLAGPHGLGLFSIAYEIATLPITELGAPINRAVFPGYAKLSSDPRAFVDNYLNVIGTTALLALPAAAGIAVTADLLVGVFLGPKWLDAIPLVKIMAVFGALVAVQTNNGYALIAAGRPNLLTFLVLPSVVTVIGLLVWLTAQAGVRGAAWAYLASGFYAPLSLYVVSRVLHFNVGALLAVLWRPAFATGVMIVMVDFGLMKLSFLEGLVGQILQLVIAFAIGVTTYGGTLLILWRLPGELIASEQFLDKRIMALIGLR